MSAIPLSLYVHLPWCIRKCPYCDFNSHPSVGGMDEPAYIEALSRDLQLEIDEHHDFLSGREISSIFFGGGTPSLFSAQGIAQILDKVDQQLSLASDVEITLEANPGSSEQAKFSDYRSAGVNRLSIGIQSFDESKLEILGRIHGREEALQATQAARRAGFDNFNLDLMYALPGQTLESAAADLQQAIELAPSHISYYQLTMEPGTHFYLHPPPLPDDELCWDMQLQGEALLQQADYTQYEVSAYARTDRTCRHNLNYWQFGDYIGIGAGAHGKLTESQSMRVVRTSKQRIPAKYMTSAGSSESVTEHRDIMMEDRPFEFLLNALRLRSGFSLDTFRQNTGLSPDKLKELLTRERFIKLGRFEEGRFNTTPLGWRHIDSILSGILDGRPDPSQKLV